MITVELDNFSLKEICQSGTVFSNERDRENTYELSGGRPVSQAHTGRNDRNFLLHVTWSSSVTGSRILIWMRIMGDT